jgi:hypothetical protein
MDHQVAKSLAALTTEITMAATAKVCQGFTPWRIEAIAVPLAEALVDIVISQGNTAIKHHPVVVSNYTTFELWNQILDEIAKEIPCVSTLEVIGRDMTRAQRAAFLTGDWRKNGASNGDPRLS